MDVSGVLNGHGGSSSFSEVNAQTEMPKSDILKSINPELIKKQTGLRHLRHLAPEYMRSRENSFSKKREGSPSLSATSSSRVSITNEFDSSESDSSFTRNLAPLPGRIKQRDLREKGVDRNDPSDDRNQSPIERVFSRIGMSPVLVRVESETIRDQDVV